MGETFQPGAWSVDMEVNLFHSMRSHKPVGVNRHFHMVIIHDKLTSPTTKKLTAKDVWDHLATMYDLQALNESEILPFPNKPVDFKLPGSEYTQLCESEFPRMHNVGSTPTSSSEETKTKHEGQAKGGKVSRSDTKTSDVRKSDSKSSSQSEHKSTHSSKTDSKSSSAPSGRGEGKGGGKVGGQSSSSHSASSTPVPSPKRTKRTRHNQSATSSPASDAPSSKRRR